MSLLSLVELLLLPLWIALGHAVGCRLSKGVAPQKVALVCALLISSAVGGLVFVREYPQAGSPVGLAMVTAILSFGLAHVYFHLFNMSETARRIRILIELKLENVPRPSTEKPAQVVDKRLERMIALNQVRSKDGKYLARASWLLPVALLVRWHERWLFPRR